MSCNTIIAVSKGCITSNRGSIEAIYVADQTSITGTTSSSANTITIIGMNPADNFVAIEFNRNAGSFTEELVRSDVGAKLYNQNVQVTVPRRDISKRNAISILAEGDRELALIVKDNNGYFWYFPNMILSSNTGGSGENRPAGSAYALGFTNEAASLAVDVSSSIIAGLL